MNVLFFLYFFFLVLNISYFLSVDTIFACLNLVNISPIDKIHGLIRELIGKNTAISHPYKSFFNCI